MGFRDLSPWQGGNIMDFDERLAKYQKDYSDFFSTFAPIFNRGEGENQRLNFSPSIDISENDNEYSMNVELAGISKDDIDVIIEDDIIEISGTKNEERSEDSNGSAFSERKYGSFSRRFSLPENIDKEKINADFKNGLLKITMPKSEVAKERKRKIKIV